MYQDLEPSSVKQFCGTARRFGFKGDIVIAVYDGTADRLQKEFKSSNAIIYNVVITFTSLPFLLFPIIFNFLFLKLFFFVFVKSIQVKTKCTGANHDIFCTLYNETTAYPINMIRYYFYKWWAVQYSESSVIMM
jgi:hypothetical protein